MTIFYKMNVVCVICSDLFIPSAEVYITKCGHMFHQHCILNWFERQKTCPHCRRSVTEKNILKVFFSVAASDNNTEDPGILLSKVENLQCQLLINQKDLKKYRDKALKFKNVNQSLREMVKELENKERINDSAIHALKEQIVYFKSKAKEKDGLSTEIEKLKQTVKDFGSVQVAIEGSREQVKEMLRNEHNVESLAILVVTLKKSLFDTDKKKRNADLELKKLQNELARLKRECHQFTCENLDLRKDLQHLRSSYEQEKRQWKTKITELRKLPSERSSDITNTSCHSNELENSECYLASEPKSAKWLPEKCDRQKIANLPEPPSSSAKSSSALDYTSFLKAKFRTNSIVQQKNEYSIFNSTYMKLDDIEVTRKGEVTYNGLGGSSKDDVFPSPKPAPTGLKRQKSKSTSASKFKKLCPNPNKKLTDFVKTSIQ